MAIGLHIQIEDSDDKKIVRVEGRIDAASAPALENKLTSLIEDKQIWILMDFSKVDYLSSAGMRLLLSLTKKLKSRGGKLALCGMGEEVMEIIKMAGFERILHIYPTEKEALGNLR